ncbi:MAG: nucleotidyltransferase substrate binding protein [Clostridiales bacterium]|nr:nucleotidyltransferase substrate binding protein [Clostridiales bacterium]MCC8115470.1 nucleotidyltransferase substrate binding protein [Bacteroidales bacterium]
MDVNRWRQRLNSYSKALQRLEEGLMALERALSSDSEVDDLLRDGVIQRFEFTHELAWNVLKDYAEYQGYTNVRGSRDAIRLGLHLDLIKDAEWMTAIEDRNLTAHDYDEEKASEIYERIHDVYFPLFKDLEATMISLL